MSFKYIREIPHVGDIINSIPLSEDLNKVKGLMIESYLAEGSQKISGTSTANL